MNILPYSTLNCPDDNTLLHWEQIGGMRVYKLCADKKGYYSAQCPKCGKYFNVERVK